MTTKKSFFVTFILLALSQATVDVQQQIVSPQLISGRNQPETCPSADDLQAARNKVSDLVLQKLTPHKCGSGNWRQFFYLNMSKPSQTCPSGWNQITNPHRACTGTPFNCASVYIASGGQAYREVCGEISGIGIGLPDAFYRHTSRNGRRIERNYLDGVSITYGSAGSRQHIWSFGMGHTHRCPCDLPSSTFQAPSPPTEVGNNFYCTSVSDSTETPLWQGSNCGASDPCCSYNDPPLFKTRLPADTTDNMEMRICMDEHSNDEHMYLLSVEIYVQ